MPDPKAHSEVHYVNRAGWLRAAVLGANDGLILDREPHRGRRRLGERPVRRS